MTTTAAALRARPAPPSRHAPSSPRPVRTRRAATLRVVDTAAQRRARRVRRVLAGFGLTVVVALVVAVGFHVVVAQTQIEIEELEAQVTAEQHRYEQLRLFVAAASSPERITTRARELGMVAPSEPMSVVAVPTDAAAPPGAPADSTGTTLAESWPKVKPHLESR